MYVDNYEFKDWMQKLLDKLEEVGKDVKSLVCTGLSGAPYDSQPHQTASLVVGAINTPNHPPFIAIGMIFQFGISLCSKRGRE